MEHLVELQSTAVHMSIPGSQGSWSGSCHLIPAVLFLVLVPRAAPPLPPQTDEVVISVVLVLVVVVVTWTNAQMPHEMLQVCRKQQNQQKDGTMKNDSRIQRLVQRRLSRAANNKVYRGR